jgi:hypothetical protein
VVCYRGTPRADDFDRSRGPTYSGSVCLRSGGNVSFTPELARVRIVVRREFSPHPGVLTHFY